MLARAFQKDPALESALEKRFAGLRDHFDYLTHFNKKIKKAARRGATSRPKAKKAVVEGSKGSGLVSGNES